MPLSWNEIKDRARAFSRDWADAHAEEAEAKSFLDGFFEVFGVSRRRLASFETRVVKSDGRDGYIDLLWKGRLLIEHKSRGKSLDRAYAQATDYFHGLKERELPRYVLVCDFARFRLYDLETDTRHEFALAELVDHVGLFGFMAGYRTTAYREQDPVNIQAAERMGRLHDRLLASGYAGHELEVYLVRLLFCLFAEDTGIFEVDAFRALIEERTAEDGSDLAQWLGHLFEVLNTPPEKRLSGLDEQLAAFPYVNGKLYAERLPTAAFDRTARDLLLECCALDWGAISPAIFGALFQSVLESGARRQAGAHYTTEANILKLIGPLFLDDLRAEFARVRRQGRKALFAFQQKLAGLRFLDPACGCGNFLVIAYRELRLLELEVLRALFGQTRELSLGVGEFNIRCNVDQFHGIELAEFPAQIAQTALWLMDHQMNRRVSTEFGMNYLRLPLQQSATIVQGNALRLEWRDVARPEALHYLLGNPPFVGAKFLNPAQRAEMDAVFAGIKGAGVLDYVAAWYRKAAEYLADNPAIRAAFVSTNSISQGEQVGVLWGDLLRRGVKIHFAHRTFQWSSEARGKAAVHCVILGFGLRDPERKTIFEYDDVRGDAHAMPAANINPYLIDAPDLLAQPRRSPLCPVPPILNGSIPADGGHYLFTTEERDRFLLREPDAAPWFRRWIGSDEFINGYERWCLWLGDCPPETLRRLPEVMRRIETVRRFRLASKSAPTRKLAETPTRFHVENMPRTRYLVIPEVSSERRTYIPIGFCDPDTLASNLVKIVADADLYHFGVLSSAMHMAWIRAVCGRLESRYRYSAGIVYNNFPWPDPTDKQRQKIETAAQAVLDARARHPDAALAALYDPLTMPPALVKAHRQLDAAVDAAYAKTAFAGDRDRVALLFARYRALSADLGGESLHPPRRSLR